MMMCHQNIIFSYLDNDLHEPEITHERKSM